MSQVHRRYFPSHRSNVDDFGLLFGIVVFQHSSQGRNGHKENSLCIHIHIEIPALLIKKWIGPCPLQQESITESTSILFVTSSLAGIALPLILIISDAVRFAQSRFKSVT